MPFQSKAQMKAAFGGYLGSKMKAKAKQWADETPNIKSLPEHKKVHAARLAKLKKGSQKEMKRIFFAVLVLLIPVSAHSAPFLGCDLPSTEDGTITQCQIEVTKGGVTSYQNGVCTPNSSNNAFLFLDLAGYANGIYTFKVRWANSAGWWSDFSDPFVLGKPGRPGSLRIINQ